MKTHRFSFAVLVISITCGFIALAMDPGTPPIFFSDSTDFLENRNEWVAPQNPTSIDVALLRDDLDTAGDLIKNENFAPNAVTQMNTRPLEIVHSKIHPSLEAYEPKKSDSELEKYYQLYELLLQKGADPLLKTENLFNFLEERKSPYEQAIKDNDQRLLALIRKYRKPKSPESLAALNIQALVQLIEEGRLTLEELKNKGYPESIIKQIELGAKK